MSALTASQAQLLADARNLATICRTQGQDNPGALVSGARYRTALALERKGLGALRYQNPSLGWFKAVSA